jgi:hypothetical protein
MSQPMPGGRRRIDRVLADDFCVDLAGLDVDEVRGRRAEADQEETDLSFMRRMLQGRMDLLVAEQRRRAAGEELPPLVDRLTAALASDGPRVTTGSGRHQEIVAALARLRTQEEETSELRRRVQAVADTLHAELGRRVAEGTVAAQDLIPGS